MESKVFAIGDIHGCYKTFEKLLDTAAPARNDTIVLLGDYIDRGPSPQKVIDLILELKSGGYKLVTLMGNHESMLLESRQNIHAFTNWMYNGGEATLRDFGIGSVAEMGTVYLNFFRGLRFYYEAGRYLFVHAGFNEKPAETFNDVHSMLWARKECYASASFENKTIVHGHSPVDCLLLENAVRDKQQVINVDTGCVYAHRKGLGYLSAVEFPAYKIFSCKNIDIE
ncbi:MAG: serine/threonine protein phosphatase [Bacteroidales bacterium]|nr:serine/threonine protein phosphatase [Bacteroidales bacterium]